VKPAKVHANPNDTRNIIDHYWYWKQEAIKADLDSKRHNFSILCSNLYNDFNVSCVVRLSNAFLAKELYIYGRRRFDKRGTVGTHHYERLKFIPNETDLNILDNYNCVGVDNIEGATPIEDFQYPDNVLLCFGQEQVGLPPEILAKCKSTIYIKQYGSVRSLNVACAAGIVLQDWCVKNA
jgi:tRNA G18 (ribose-2'-O)-methylase SpoU